MYIKRKKNREKKKNTDNINDLRNRMVTIRDRTIIYDGKTIIFFFVTLFNEVKPKKRPMINRYS
jgi:hypothetical protein